VLWWSSLDRKVSGDGLGEIGPRGVGWVARLGGDAALDAVLAGVIIPPAAWNNELANGAIGLAVYANV
jgi:hypothetical protein